MPTNVFIGTKKQGKGSRSFERNVPEKVIHEFTGYRSVKEFRQYEKVAVKQKRAACKILTVPLTSGSFNQEVDQAGIVLNSPRPSQFPFQMPTFNPVINSHGNVSQHLPFWTNFCWKF